MNTSQTILIIEDESASASLLSKMVRNLGYNPIIAEHGKAALKILKDNPAISLIFADYKMPVMNANTFLKKIQKQEKLKEIPIVVISGEIGYKQAGKLFERGVKSFLQKPIYKEDIAQALDQFAASYQADDLG